MLLVLAMVPWTSASAAPDASGVTPSHGWSQGRTWDSIKKLPDWSGVWVLSDESWRAEPEEVARAPLTARYQSIRAKNKADNDTGNEPRCIPVGIPESAVIPIGQEYLFTPGRVTIVFENGIVRRIDTSGRPHPSEKELDYTFAGNSIGHWVGGTLIVDTVGLSPHAEFRMGLHTTAKTQLSERIFRKDRDTLQIDTVMTDPEIFTQPWVYTRLYKRSTLPAMEYYPCTEGSRDIMVNGGPTDVDLTPPAEGK
jgi:hypothetical protein